MGNTESRDLTVFTVNMGNRSIHKTKNKKEDRKGWTEFNRKYVNIILLKKKPDIVFVQEGVPNLLNDIQKEIYNIFPQSERKKSQSLIQIIVKKNITFEELEDIPKNIKERVNAAIITYEGLAIVCASVHGRYMNKIRKSLRKNAEKENDDAFLEFLQYLDKQRKEHLRPIVIGGDFNIDADHFKKVSEKVVDSSLSVVQATASCHEDEDEEATLSSGLQAAPSDTDFFITSMEMDAKCWKLRQEDFFPEDSKLASKNIIDHSPTQIIVSLKPLQGIKAEKDVSRKRLIALTEERKDQYKKMCRALKSCDDVKFDVVDPNFDQILKKHETKVEENNLDELIRTILTFDENKALKKDIEFLTEMQFAVKAPTSGQNHG